MRREKDNFLEDKKKLDDLHHIIQKEKEDLKKAINNENHKLEKISSFNLGNLDQYDRLKIIRGEKPLVENLDSFHIDIEKYLTTEKQETNDASIMDEKELATEIQKLKSRYEEKSKKYKNIIRKIKEVIAVSKKSNSNSYSNSMGIEGMNMSIKEDRFFG